MSDPTVAQGTEQVLATIPNVTVKAGFMGFGSRLHSVILTSHRIIFVRETMAALKKISGDLRAEAKSKGEGWTGQMGAQSKAHEIFAQTYAAMNPAAILVNDPNSFAVDRSTVTDVKVKTVTPADGVQEDRLTIKTTGKKYKCVVNGSLADAWEALATAGFDVH
ncbi:MAG: hypothetical protein R2720_00710 [Candidatus Nanopelagicales bacterium]